MVRRGPVQLSWSISSLSIISCMLVCFPTQVHYLCSMPAESSWDWSVVLRRPRIVRDSSKGIPLAMSHRVGHSKHILNCSCSLEDLSGILQTKSSTISPQDWRVCLMRLGTGIVCHGSSAEQSWDTGAFRRDRLDYIQLDFFLIKKLAIWHA